MTEFKLHTKESAPEASKPFMEMAESGYGFIPNLLKKMSTSPVLLEGYMSLAGILEKSSLSETERQIILMTNNRLNGCEYCMSAHSFISAAKGVPEDVLNALRDNKPIADAKLEALRVFSAIVNEKRGWASEEEVSALIAAGYTQETVLEVIVATALKVMSNYTNHIAGTPVDEVFGPHLWKAA